MTDNDVLSVQKMPGGDVFAQQADGTYVNLTEAMRQREEAMRGTELEAPQLLGEEMAAAAVRAARRILMDEMPRTITGERETPSDVAIATLAAALLRVERRR